MAFSTGDNMATEAMIIVHEKVVMISMTYKAMNTGSSHREVPPGDGIVAAQTKAHNDREAATEYILHTRRVNTRGFLYFFFHII